MQKAVKAKRIIVNPSSNDWNDEPEYKLQKIRIYGESKSMKSYIIDSYGSKRFNCLKTQVFLNIEDMKRKVDNIEGFRLTENEKQYLLNSF